MTYEIKPVCPKCGNVLTIKLNIVDRLRAEIVELKRQLKDRDDINIFSEIFGNGRK